MAKLNHDILREVFNKLPKYKNYENSLIKFMLAGKENFKLVLDNFGQAKKAKIQNYFGTKRILTLDFIDSHGDNKKCIFPLDFLLLKAFITDAQIEEIYAMHTTSGVDVDVYEQSLMKHLIGENLKRITVLPTLPASCYDCFKQLGNLEYIEIACPDFDISMIPESCRTFKNTNIDWNFTQTNKKKTFFKTITPSRRSLLTTKQSKNVKVTSVEELNLEGDLSDSDFTTKKIKNFISFISIHFPKLRSLDILFRVDGGWLENKDVVLSLELAMFKKMSANIKGSIHFNTMELTTSLTEYKKERRILPNDCIARDDDDNAFQKSLQIHDGLSFYFVCQFFFLI